MNGRTERIGPSLEEGWDFSDSSIPLFGVPLELSFVLLKRPPYRPWSHLTSKLFGTFLPNGFTACLGEAICRVVGQIGSEHQLSITATIPKTHYDGPNTRHPAFLSPMFNCHNLVEKKHKKRCMHLQVGSNQANNYGRWSRCPNQKRTCQNGWVKIASHLGNRDKFRKPTRGPT